MKRTTIYASLTLTIAVASLLPLEGHAAEVTDLASSFDDDDPFDAHISVGYNYRLSRGAVTREGLADPGGVELFKEMRYSKIEHILNLRAEIGVWHDLQLHFQLPIILGNIRAYSFAQNGGDACNDPKETNKPEDNCVTPRNSTLVRDGLLASNLPPGTVDIADNTGIRGGMLLPNRSGLDQVYFGARYAPISQARDPTKPTWTLGFEARIAVGSPKEYDRAHPKANTSVGRGIHQLVWSMAVSRRYKYVDPWVSMAYMLPLAASGSLFDKTTFDGTGQERSSPQQVGYAAAGAEIVPWEKPEKGHKFAIALQLRVTGFFEGRNYSPIWEMFANAPRLAGPCLPGKPRTNPLLWNNGTYCAQPYDPKNPNTNRDGRLIPHPGITRIENYLQFQGRMGFNFRFTQYFLGQVGVGLAHNQAHFITFGDAGKSKRPGKPIDFDRAEEVNPMHRPLVDTVGRRFRVEESTIFDFFISAQGMF